VDEDRMENAAKWIRRQWGKVQVNSAVQRSFAIRFDAVCIEDYVVRLAVCHESARQRWVRVSTCLVKGVTTVIPPS